MFPTMRFETVPLEKIKHIIERADGRNGQNVDIPAGQNRKPRRKAPKRKRSESVNRMNLRFNNFKIETDGIPCWLGAAESLENAKHHLRQWAPKEFAAQFLLFDQVTGEKKIVTADEISLQNFSNGE